MGIPCINGTAYRGTPATEALKEGSLIILESFTDYERDEHGDIVHKKDGSPKPFGTAFQYLPDEPGAAPLTAKAHYLPSKSRFCGLNIKEFLVQYGYRDIVDFLEAHGYKPETTARK